MKRKPVVIVGGGLAGLACGLELSRRQVPITILEQNSTLGGRVTTRRHRDGYLLDEGFQVLLNSYPELQHFLNLEDLELKKFHSGAMVFDGKAMKLLANPVAHPQLALSNVFNIAVSLSDQLRVVSLVAKAQSYRSDDHYLGVTTEKFLLDHGFSAEFLDFFWRPFLAGVFLDEGLSVDAGFFLFLLRCFGLGEVSLPRRGMSEIPRQMQAQLSAEQIRTGCRVSEIQPDGVRLASGEWIEAEMVVDASGAARGLESSYRSVETFYFSTEDQVPWEKWLVLVPPRLGLKINHVAVLSHVSTDYSPEGRTLISASVIGPKVADEKSVAKEIELLMARPCPMRFVESIRVRRALPIIADKNSGVRTDRGIVHCGDDMASPSINGALRSGRLAAETVAKGLKEKIASFA